MTRFWISLPQGVSFVLSSLAMMRGGEIFIPKIPSMKVVDLATALAPKLPHKIVGIRPGEKLHEVMVSEDDSRETTELSDRYVIYPSIHPWGDADTTERGGSKVTEGFRYASDSNSEWIDADGMRKLLSDLGIEIAVARLARPDRERDASADGVSTG